MPGRRLRRRSTKPLRICWQHRCPHRIDAAGRCPVHGRKPRWDTDRPNAGQSGYGAAWRRIRAGNPRTRSGHVHELRRAGDTSRPPDPRNTGADDESNLAVCCLCHDRRTGRAGQAARRPRSRLYSRLRGSCRIVITVISASVADGTSTASAKRRSGQTSAPHRRDKASRLAVRTSHFRNNPSVFHCFTAVTAHDLM